MKKSIALLLVFTIITSTFLTACNNNQVEPPTNTEVPNSGQTEAKEAANKESSQSIAVDENLLTVDITLPASLMGDTSTFKETEYLAKNEGMKSAKLNDDGSITVTMTKKKHKEVMDEMKVSIDESFGDLIEAIETPYIKGIDYTDNYKEVTISVDKVAYENAFDMTSLIVGLSTSMYQTFLGEEIGTIIIFKDIATGEQIESVTYPVN